MYIFTAASPVIKLCARRRANGGETSADRSTHTRTRTHTHTHTHTCCHTHTHTHHTHTHTYTHIRSLLDRILPKDSSLVEVFIYGTVINNIYGTVINNTYTEQ